jgi:lincosamide and streptogramin A transport system ATP-binding/permease protein
LGRENPSTPDEDVMSSFALSNIRLHFPGHEAPIFEGLTLRINSRWRCGLVGRNGRGKTTLLNILSGEIQPDSGDLALPVKALLLPRANPSSDVRARDVIRNAVAPFQAMEDEPPGGYDFDSRLEKECSLLGIGLPMLERPFCSLSGGEQARAMIAALFLHRDTFPLLDEPTDHLDLAGRERLAAYLRTRSGFLLASHDRDLLDACTDHTIAITRTGVDVFNGRYSSWMERMALRDETERRRSEKIEREVRELSDAARERRGWSFEREAGKRSAADSGFEGARAARVMKRARAIERRIDRELEEKRSLLLDRETVYPLCIEPPRRLPGIVARLDGVTVGFGGSPLQEGVSLEIRKGERIALKGPNGCGKTSLLRMLAGEIAPAAGSVYRSPSLAIAVARQHPLWNEGNLRPLVRNARIDETRFRTILGALGVTGEVFERPLETFSYGQRKKVELARALAIPADLHLWDEPTNAIDLYAREELERAVLEAEPTMLFIDHDSAFIRSLATRTVELPRAPQLPPGV